MENQINELKKDSQAIKKAVREQTFGYIIAALGLVAGLAWNEAIKGLIERFFPVSGGGLMVKFIYAAGITIAVIIAGYYLAKISNTKEN